MKGELYAIGVGPGDPELLTLKGLRLLQGSDCIMACRSEGEERSLALSIVDPYLDRSRQEIVLLDVSMGSGGSGAFWEEVADGLEGRLGRGRQIAFLALGHPLFYSSFLHLLRVLRSREFPYTLEIVPGITSWGAASAVAQLPLGQGREGIAILPGNVEKENLRGLLEGFPVIILLKVNRQTKEEVALLREEGVPLRATLAVRCGLEGEQILRDWEPGEKDPEDYLSLLILERGP